MQFLELTLPFLERTNYSEKLALFFDTDISQKIHGASFTLEQTIKAQRAWLLFLNLGHGISEPLSRHNYRY